MGKSANQEKAGVTLSVSRCGKLLRKGLPEKHVSSTVKYYLAGTMEELIQQLLTRAADNAQDTKTPGHTPTKRVYATDLIKAVRHDPDLSRAFAGFAFGSLERANKPIDHILPADEAKKRADDIRQKKAEKKAERKKNGQPSKEKARK
ncbi:MAG: hypothetical protein CMB11_08105 [Euryarchaeota archaeon]|nr:hypothetical protein [Euryarchaeota archaeon]|tara:strand:- start:115 stop:558 length:444 start_codon:yes stop_codon:yes gene_type:complete